MSTYLAFVKSEIASSLVELTEDDGLCNELHWGTTADRRDWLVTCSLENWESDEIDATDAEAMALVKAALPEVKRLAKAGFKRLLERGEVDAQGYYYEQG